jgi:hypothetical protein
MPATDRTCPKSLSIVMVIALIVAGVSLPVDARSDETLPTTRVAAAGEVPHGQ